jgi:hypothetical protein
VPAKKYRQLSVNDTPVMGRKYKDIITGFQGVCTGYTKFIYGCTRVMLESLVEGKPETYSFDAPGLLDLEDPMVKAEPARTGGPRLAPARRSAPTRR